LPPLHPPPAALSRALWLRRRGVPRRGERLRAVARATVLQRDRRGGGRAGVRGAPGGARAVKSRLLGLVWFFGAAALPVAAWHGVAERLAARFRMDLGYLVSAWGGFALIALGLLCFVALLIS